MTTTQSPNESATPRGIWKPIADAVGGFDVDPASGAEPEPIASTRYTKEDDGLAESWAGDVWLNPPWVTEAGGCGEKEKWLDKAVAEAATSRVDTVTVLMPADPWTHWFHDYIAAAPVLCLLGPGRITFEYPGGDSSYGCLIAVYGDPTPAHISALDELGAVYRGIGKEVAES